MGEKIWAFVNSKIGLALLGFMLTSVFAGWINNQYQELAWLGKKQLEILERTLDEQEVLTKELAGLMDDRFFWLQKAYWALQGNELAYFNKTWTEDYYPTVVNWNRHLNGNIHRISHLTRSPGYAVDERFYTDEDDISYQAPETVHGYFKAAYYAVRSLACCRKITGFCNLEKDVQRCATDEQGIIEEGKVRLRQLARHNTAFLSYLHTAFDAHNKQLDLQGKFLPLIRF